MVTAPRLTRFARWCTIAIAVLAVSIPSARAAGPTPPEAVLYEFHGTDGSAPYELVQGVDGTLYGATAHGGANGSGTIFALKPPARGGRGWTMTIVASIPAGLSGHFTIDPNGTFALDGSTPQGGLPGPYNGYCDYWGRDLGCGSVFRVTPPAGGVGGWTTTTIYEFTGLADGGEPTAILASGGSLFGTAGSGGLATCYGRSGCGGAFSLVPPQSGQTAWRETLLMPFLPGPDGLPPASSLLGVGYNNAYAYGMYSYGDGTENVFSFRHGTFSSFGPEGVPGGIIADERGAVYVWTSTATLYVLYPPNFTKYPIFRLPPSGARVVLARGGAVYMLYSPPGKSGSVVALTPADYHHRNWKAHVLYTFGGGADGADPSTLISGRSGDLYGTTSAGGVANDGVVFRLTVNPAP